MNRGWIADESLCCGNFTLFPRFTFREISRPRAGKLHKSACLSPSLSARPLPLIIRNGSKMRIMQETAIRKYRRARSSRSALTRAFITGARGTGITLRSYICIKRDYLRCTICEGLLGTLDYVGGAVSRGASPRVASRRVASRALANEV